MKIHFVALVFLSVITSNCYTSQILTPKQLEDIKQRALSTAAGNRAYNDSYGNHIGEAEFQCNVRYYIDYYTKETLEAPAKAKAAAEADQAQALIRAQQLARCEQNRQAMLALRAKREAEQAAAAHAKEQQRQALIAALAAKKALRQK